jgi:hypothetical protein
METKRCVPILASPSLEQQYVPFFHHFNYLLNMCFIKCPSICYQCCKAGSDPINICVFKGERTTYQTAADRCSKYGVGYSTCSWSTVDINWDCGTDTSYGQGDWSIQSSPGMRFSWTSDSCSMKAQIDINGNVAIIHSVQSNTVKERVAVDKGEKV